MEATVATILNSRELAISVGHEHGVVPGMVFAVKEKPHQIMDPVTLEALGEMSREKVRVRVVEVNEKFSVCRTFEKLGGSSASSAVNFGNVSNRLAAAGIFSGPEPRTRSLRTGDERGGFEPLTEANSYVKTGDPIELISTPEEQPEVQPKATAEGLANGS